MTTKWILSVLFAGFAPTLLAYPEGEPPAEKEPLGPMATRYEPEAARITRAALDGHGAYRKLEELCDGIGHRLSGSKELEQATRWAAEALKRDGQEGVRLEPVTVPRWVRGRESLTMLKPRVAPLAMVGLGGSVGTPAAGITAPVVCVADKEALDALGESVSGKIVLFNYPMPAYDRNRGAGYGRTVQYRHKGSQWAAQHGAVASLVRSVTARSLRSPHTGAMSYGEAKVRVPSAAVSIEDAEMIARLQSRGIEVVVNLKMEARNLGDAPSANVIGELRGTTKPDEIVVIGGHIDSWDVGQGAHDDGTGCAMAMEAINVLRRLNMIPRRTIRVVLWTNEENGLRGGKAYAQEHADELDKHVAAIESDSGGFKPEGYSLECKDENRQAVAVEQMRDILGLVSSIAPMELVTGHSGADVSPLRESGVILLGHSVEGSTYFDYHHSHADTLDKVNPVELSQNVAVLATVAYILADMPQRLGEK